MRRIPSPTSSTHLREYANTLRSVDVGHDEAELRVLLTVQAKVLGTPPEDLEDVVDQNLLSLPWQTASRRRCVPRMWIVFEPPDGALPLYGRPVGLPPGSGLRPSGRRVASS